MPLPTERFRNLRVRLADLPGRLAKLPIEGLRKLRARLDGLPGRLGKVSNRFLLALSVVSLLLILVPGLTRLDRSEESSGALASGARIPGLGESPELRPSQYDAEPLEYTALDPGSDRFAARLEEPWLDAEPGGVGEEDLLTLACIIEPNQVVAIGSPVTGLIEAIPVERADVVEEGQVLVKLEAHVEQAAVELARTRARMDEGVLSGKARLELGERRRSRVNKLFENNAASQEQREEAETEAELARLELERARAEKKQAGLDLRKARAVLDRRTIHSPIAGVVMERSMSPGERVDQETILKVAQIDPLRVEVILPSAMFGSIEPGARATVVPEIPGDTVHVASVTIVDRVVDAASGTFGIGLELPNPDHAIPGGVHCQVRFLEE